MLLLSLIVVLGFLATGVLGYVAARGVIRGNLTQNELPLTGDTVYSEVQRELLRPIAVSAQMAHDTFLRDWVTGGERDTDQVVRYLASVKGQFGANTSFFISERTRKYYYDKGIAQTINAGDPRDRWYFRVRVMKEPYELNADPDTAHQGSMTIFINYRLLDDRGRYLGITGVGVTIGALNGVLQRIEGRYHRQVYFVNRAGEVVLASRQNLTRQGSIATLPGIAAVAPQILASTERPLTISYRQGPSTVQVNARYIKELGWFLVIEQDEAPSVAPFLRLLLINLGVGLLATLLVLGLTVLAVNQHQRRLETLATTDPLTGLLNRGVGEALLEQGLRETVRSGAPLCVILFDIDHFKGINDGYGHAAGDTVIRQVAQLARSALRAEDALVRWGGEEYLVILKGCPEERGVQLAEAIRRRVEGHPFSLDVPGLERPVTVSLGVAQHGTGDSGNATTDRADRALYAAKRDGRNCVMGTLQTA